MQRRKLLQRLIQASLALLIVPYIAESKNNAATLTVKNLPPDYDTVSLGSEYLNRYQQYRQQNALLNSLFDATEPPRRVEQFLVQAIASDFERDATLRVGGWLYSETELKLCALHCMARV